jgi:DNA-binding CsgD family transcriptional regulator
VQEAVHTLMLVCAFGGRADLWTAFQQAVTTAAHYLTPALRLAAISFADPAHVTAQQLAELDELVTSANHTTDPVRVLEVATAGHYVDREPTTAMDRVARAGRNGGPVPLAAQAQVMLAMTAFHEGRWEEATSRAEEGVALCVEHGYQLLEWGMLNPLMLVAAARGDSAYLAGVRDRLRHWPVPRQMLAARGFTGNVDGLEALSMARYADAHAAYSSVAEPGTLPAYSQAVLWNVLEVVEAALGSDHLEEARAHTAVTAATLAPISPRLRFQAAAAAALTAPDAGYRAAFDRVVDDPAAMRWPFHLARTELAYGERLRRDRAARLARSHLERAVELFTGLEATPWIDRAEAALRATGRTRHPSGPEDRARLTPQELQVAQLAASGLTNREIADRMHLSPRTVGAHLYRAFPKLGVGTRAGLRDALSQYAE